MKKNILLLVSWLLLLGSATAQTNVSGFISANTTWTLAGSPYVVVGNALLSHGYTLTIEPGVVVKFNDSTALQIDGELLAIGTASQRITFTSNQTIPAAGDWAKIHFADTSVSATYDASGNYLSGCIMKYCDVLYGGQLGFGEIHIVNSSPYFSQCRILNSSSSGIYCFGSTCLIDSSSAKNCTNAGFAFYQYFSFSCGLLIQGDTLQNNGSGVFLDTPNYPCMTTIRKNYFISNGVGISNASGMNNLLFEENYFINNTLAGGITIGGNSGNGIIQCNLFQGNHSISGAISVGGGTGSTIIRDNVFDNNTSTGGVSVLTYNISYATASPYFTNNIIKNNSSPFGKCCSFVPLYNANYLLHIEQNEFTNNTANSIIYISGSANTSSLNIYLKHNNLINPNSRYEIYNDIAYGFPNVYADSNYWGSTSTQHIDSVIYDYFDFANKAVVYYSPILTFPVDIDTSCSPVFPTSINNYGSKSESANITSTLFPNPFTTTATIKFSRAVHAATLRIYNMYGQHVAESSNINGESFRINAEHFRSGVYVYEVTEKEKKICGGKAVVY